MLWTCKKHEKRGHYTIYRVPISGSRFAIRESFSIFHEAKTIIFEQNSESIIK